MGTHAYFYRNINFFLLCSGSSEAQDTKYNQMKLINVPSLYEQQNDIKYDNVQYVLKLHPWKKTIKSFRATGPSPKPKSKKKKAIVSPATGRTRAKAVNLGLPSSPTSGRRSNSVQIGPNTFKKKKNSKNNSSKKKKLKPKKTKSNLTADEDITTQTRGRAKARSKQQTYRQSKSVAVLPKNQVIMSKVTHDVNFDKYSYGKCMISMLQLPDWGWLKQKRLEAGNGRQYGNYKMFLRCGGIRAEFDEHTSDIDLFLFNAANANADNLHFDRDCVIDCYYAKLPSFRKELESPFILFSNRRSSLYSFGGYNDGKALTNISECKLDVKTLSGLKWRKNKNKQTLIKGRYATNVCAIGNEKYLILGGKNKKTKDEKTVELYNNDDACEDVTCQSVETMKYKRSNLSSVFLSQKNKVIVAGGMIYGKGSSQIEIFDVNKNKWTLNKAEFNFEHKYPVIWMDACQPSICYVAGDWIGIGGRKDSLGYMEWIDLRQKQRKWNLFHDDTLTDMFKIDGVRANVWESRSLTRL